MSRLEDLILLNQSGAIDPASAVQSMWGLQDARKQKRQDRLAAAVEQQSGLLDALVSTAQTAATEGQTFGEVRPLLESIFGAAGQPAPERGLRQIPGIAPLFGQGGYSTVTPDLDPEDESVIAMEVFNAFDPEAQTPLQEIRQRIHTKLASMPNYSSLGPSIDRVIEQAYGRATKGL